MEDDVKRIDFSLYSHASCGFLLYEKTNNLSTSSSSSLFTHTPHIVKHPSLNDSGWLQHAVASSFSQLRRSVRSDPSNILSLQETSLTCGYFQYCHGVLLAGERL